MACAFLSDELGDILRTDSGDPLTVDCPYTRLGPDGYGVRHAHGFGGKAGSDGHPVSRITRFGLEGFGVRRAGSFADKGFQGHPVGKITRLGPDGYGVKRCGSFANKAAGVTPPQSDHTGSGITGGWFSRKKWHDLKDLLEAQRRVEELAEEKSGKEATALDQAAGRAAQALELIHQARLDELNKFARMQSLLEAAAQAETMAARIRAANQAAVVATRIIRDLEEEEEAIAFFLLN